MSIFFDEESLDHIHSFPSCYSTSYDFHHHALSHESSDPHLQTEPDEFVEMVGQERRPGFAGSSLGTRHVSLVDASTIHLSAVSRRRVSTTANGRAAIDSERIGRGGSFF